MIFGQGYKFLNRQILFQFRLLRLTTVRRSFGQTLVVGSLIIHKDHVLLNRGWVCIEINIRRVYGGHDTENRLRLLGLQDCEHFVQTWSLAYSVSPSPSPDQLWTPCYSCLLSCGDGLSRDDLLSSNVYRSYVFNINLSTQIFVKYWKVKIPGERVTRDRHKLRYDSFLFGEQTEYKFKM